MPFFSIITPTYNRAKFISKALESVLKQTFLDFEYIIIDDGSTDNTKEIIKTFSDSRIRYIYQENQERSVARNHGINLAKGQYICFLDSDDYYLENHLKILRNTIIKTSEKLGLYYTQSYMYNVHSKKTTPITQIKDKNQINFLLNNFLFINSICVSSTIMKQEEYHFPIAYNSWEDLFVWFQVAAVFPIYFINKRTTVICVHNSNSSSIFTLKDINYTVNRFNCIDVLFTKLSDLLTESQKLKYINNDAHNIICILINDNQIEKSIAIWFYILRKYFNYTSIHYYIKIAILIILKRDFNSIYNFLKRKK